MFEILACIIVYLGAKMIEWGFKLAWLLIKACWYIITFPFQLLKLATGSSKGLNKSIPKHKDDYDEDEKWEEEMDWIDELEMYDAIFDDED